MRLSSLVSLYSLQSASDGKTNIQGAGSASIVYPIAFSITDVVNPTCAAFIQATSLMGEFFEKQSHISLA